MGETNVTLEVDRGDFGRTRLLEAELGDLAEGSVRLRVDRFALTANNVTYAQVGDMLGYWDFFPTEAGWGRIPAMGWAEVVESAHPDVDVGGRYFGWYPMSRWVDLSVGVTATGIRDDGAHRQAHAAVYRSYTNGELDPFRPEGGFDAEVEERHALLRGLFLTGLLVDEFFADRSYDGAATVVVLSASSKTAISFAQRVAERGGVEVVGLTSAGNVAFVEGLGFYDRVLAYDAVADLPADGDAVLVDMSGNRPVVAAVHDWFGERLKYSMIVGFSHHDAPQVEVTSGPGPQLFFAPTEIDRRMAEWGPEEYERRSGDALVAFVDGSRKWLSIDRRSGSAETEAAYADVYAGRVPPDVGTVVSVS